MQIQKIISTPISICLRIRTGGKNIFLNLPRGGGFRKVFKSTSVPSSSLRIKDKFSEYVKSHIEGHDFSALIKAREENAFCVLACTRTTESFLSLFYKGNQTFFVFAQKQIESNAWNCFVPWENRSISTTNSSPFFDFFKDLGFREPSRFDPVDYEKIADDGSLEEILKRSMKPNKQLIKLEKKVLSIESDLFKIARWRKLKFDLEKFNTSGNANYIRGYIKKEMEAVGDYQKMSILWDKVKKLKNAEVLQKSRLSNCIEELFLMKSSVSVLPEVHSPEWKTAKSKPKNFEKSSTQEYLFDGLRIAIGSNSYENQQLRKEWANKDDYWFHPFQKVGPHLFVKMPTGKTLTLELMEIFAGIILEKMPDSISPEIELVYTTVKNLKPIKGSIGGVTYKNNKVIKLNADLKWREKVSISSK